MAINYTPGSANVRSSFASLMKNFPELRKAFYDNFKMLPPLLDHFLVMENSTKSTETENTIGGRGEWSSKSEAAEYTFGDYAQGTEKVYTHTTYAEAFDVTQELIEDNQWSSIMKTAKEMARGGYSAKENNGADVLNNAFSSGTGTDGSYLCVTTHNLINSGSTGSNALTTPLSADGLEAAYVIADNIVNEANIIIPTNFTTLVVPPSLRREAEELKGSDKTPSNANNAINVYKNEITKIVVDPYLSSSTAWFLVDTSTEARGKFFWRVKPQFISDKSPYSDNLLMKARERFSYGHTDWQGCIGSTGAA